MSGSNLPTYTSSSSSSRNENAIPQSPNSSSNLSKALRNTIPLNSGPPALSCPVSGCSMVFKGEIAHEYLWRHLKRPGIHRRAGDEKTAWLNLHKIEHDRLLATRLTRAQRRRETNKVKAQKMLRTAELEQRAKSMGITEKALVAQKVAIWEGMRSAV
ncbi:hypothetical protein B9Z19DRAFT_1119431 [Tuber borchii]|uniref:Uncharacterized protein n=1 Tax=Tuber borchii TaxID=42251 RepID=A0A2T7A6J3_TUBBO|nr:hypothetical protein B9Z19DRAFT_1119431 [Tuber borchii]